jgi:glutathione peroxidase
VILAAESVKTTAYGVMFLSKRIKPVTIRQDGPKMPAYHTSQIMAGLFSMSWQKMRVITGALLMVLGFFTGRSVLGADAVPQTPINAHAFSFTAIDGQRELRLGDYAGKYILIVNTASLCGFTKQYKWLQEFYSQNQDRLVVLGVPSNDFGDQEPDDEKAIKNFCEVNFRITFPMTQKYAVTGDDAHPFYVWAAAQFSNPLAKPRWNFHKYLIGPDGNLVDWFSSATTDIKLPETQGDAAGGVPKP